MLTFQSTLGNYSNNVNPIFLPKTKSPSIILLPQENFIELFSLKSGKIIAILKKFSKEYKRIVIMVAHKSWKIKTLSIAVGFENGCIQIWKINTIKTSIFCTVLKGHMNEISRLHYHEEKNLLLSGCEKGCFVFWDVDKKKGILRVKKAHMGKIDFLFFTGKTRYFFYVIISSGADNLIKFWNTRSGSCLKIINIGMRIDYGLGIKNDKIIIFSNKKSKIFFIQFENLFDLKVEKKIKVSAKLSEPTILVSKKKNIIFIYGKNRKIEILFLKKNFRSDKTYNRKLTQKKEIQKYSNFFKEKVKTLDFWEKKNSREIFVLVQYCSNFLDVFMLVFPFKTECKEQIKFINIFQNNPHWCQGDIRELIWFSNDFLLASLSGFSKTINIWFLHSQKCPRILPLNSKGLCMALNTNNNILVGTKEGGLELFDIYSGNLIFSKLNAHVGPIWSLEVINDFFQLASGGTDGNLKLWEFGVNGINLLKYLEIGDQILGMKIIPKQNIIAVNCLSSKLLFFRFSNLQFSFSFDGYSMPIITLAVDHEDCLLVTGSADNLLRIWNLNQRELKKSISYHESSITSVCFQKFNGNLFSGSRNGKICFWKEKNYTLLSEVNNFHRGPVWALSVSENGKFLASGSQCKKLILWRIDENLDANTKNFQKNIGEEVDYLSQFSSQKKSIINELINTDQPNFEINHFLKSGKTQEINQLESAKKIFGEISKNEWLNFIKNNKNEQILSFLNLIFENLERCSKNDIFSNLNKIIELFKISREINSNTQINDWKLIERKIKLYTNKASKIVETNLRTLKLLKKSSENKRSDLPDSN
jgi:U3 small nucleolar RNA-associated protein 12